MTHKQPKWAIDPAPQKKIFVNAMISNDAESIYWSFAMIDCEGVWGFHNICKDRFHQLIVSELKNKEGLSWAQLKVSGSHNIEKNKLHKNAIKRLKELNLDELETLFSLRLTGKERMWGIRQGNVLQILWWDPEHKICPAPKKHT